MPAGRVIGRVSVKVLPDTDDFKHKAKNDLERIARTLKVQVPTTIDMSGASRELLAEIRKMNQRNKALSSRHIKLYTTLDTSGNHMKGQITKALRSIDDQIKTGKRNPKLKIDLVAGTLRAELDKQSLRDIEDKLKNWRDKMSPLKVIIRPELALGSTTWAEKRLDYLTRPRTVPLIPMLNSMASVKAAAGIGSLVAALSGGRVSGDMFDNLWRAFKNLDKSVPLISSIATAIAGLGAVGITAVSNLAALSVTLAQIGAAAFALPGFFAAAAIGIGITVIALKDMKKHVPDITARFKEMGNTIRENFWSTAANGIRSLVDVYLPELGAISKDIGRFWGTLAGEIAKPLKSSLPTMMGNLAKAIGITNGFAGTFASIINTLGLTGSEYLPKFAQWFGDIAKKFDGWLSKAAASGELQEWIDAGIQGLKDLGNIIGDLGGIFAGIGRAAAAGGGSTLSMVADTLDRIHAVVDSADFQAGLANAFNAAHTAMTAISTGAGPAIKEFFSWFGTTLTTVMPLAGMAIGNLLGGIADALAQPGVRQGLTDLFVGINNAVQGLMPALAPIGAMLGQLGSTIGTFLGVIGPMIGTVLGALAPVMTSLFAALEPLIVTLGGALGGIMTSLAPVIGAVGAAFVGLVTALGPVIQAVVDALLPAFQQIIPIIGGVLIQALNSLVPLFPLIGQMIATVVPLVLQLVAAFLPLLPVLIQLAVQVLTPLIPIITNLAMTVLPPLIAAIQQLVPAIIPVLGMIGQFAAFLLDILSPAITWIAELVVGMVTSLIGGITSIFTGIQQIFQGFVTMFSGGWQNFWDGILMVGQGIWNIIKGAFDVLMNIGIFKLASLGLSAIKGLFTKSWGAITGGLRFAWAGIKGLVSGGISAVKGFISGGLNTVKGWFGTTWTQIKTDLGIAWQAIKEGVGKGITAVVTFVKELPGKCLSALGDIGSTLLGAGQKIIQGFLDGIKRKFEDVKQLLGKLTDLLPDWKGPAKRDGTILIGAGQLVIDGFIKGLESRYDAVRQSLSGLTDDVAATTFSDLSVPSITGQLSRFDPIADPSTGLFGTGGGANVEVNIPVQTDANPEDIADSMLFALRRVSSGGVYATRKG